MSKRIYPVTVENGELVESNEKLTVNGLPIAKDGTIDVSNVSGSSSEWTVDANGNLVPKDGEPVQVGSLRSDELSITAVGGVGYQTTVQTISNATTTKADLDSVESEDTAVVDVDATNNQIVVQKAGTYVVTAFVTWASASGWATGDDARLMIYVNGGRVVDPFHRKVGTGAEGFFATYQSELATGDTIDMRLYQKSGASKDTSSGQDQVRLEVGRLG